MHRAALVYALDFGIPIFPIWPRNKNPLTAHGFKDATTDRGQIDEWFARWPDANIAMPTGRPETFDVADFDSDSARPIYRRLRRDVPDASVVLTGGGGRHVWLAPTGRRQRGRAGTGVDWRGRGQYVVLPPSRHYSGRRYEFIPGHRPRGASIPRPPVPIFLLDFLEHQPDDEGEAPEPPTGDNLPPPGYIEAALRSEIERLARAREGGRNVALNESAWRLGQMVGAGWLREAEVVEQVTAVALRIELEPEEIPRTIRSGLKAGRQKPRVWRDELEEAQEKRRARMRRKVTRELDAEAAAAGFRAPLFLRSLADDLAENPEELPTTIERLHRTGWNSLISAAAKTGKTELGVEICRCLVDGEPFLNEFATTLAGRVGYLNYELGKAQMVDTFRIHRIQHPERISTLNLRGMRLPLEAEVGREWLMRWLRDLEIEVLILDPLSRALTGDEDKKTEVEPFLEALDGIKLETGVRDLFVIHHFGHSGERARGSSRLLGWPDALWTYTRFGQDRYLEVEGRIGAGLDESKLVFDTENHQLEFVGGSRKEGADDLEGVKKRAREERVKHALGKHPDGLSQRGVEREVKGTLTVVRSVLKGLLVKGVVTYDGKVYRLPSEDRL